MTDQLAASGRNPAGFQAPPHEGAGARPGLTHTQTATPFPPTLAVTGDGGTDLVEMLGERGVVPVNAAALVAEHPSERVRLAVAWFDEQRAGSVGAGVLVKAIREGRVPSKQRSVGASAAEYAAQILAWLGQHFSELVDEYGATHHQAVIAVIHLHHLYGKSALTRQQHGPEIRAYVDSWNARYPDLSRSTHPTKEAQ